MTMTHSQIQTAYQRINPALVGDQVLRELREIAKATGDFSDPDLVDVFSENFADLYRIIRERHPDALEKAETAKTASSGKAKPPQTVVLPPMTTARAVTKPKPSAAKPAAKPVVTLPTVTKPTAAKPTAAHSQRAKPDGSAGSQVAIKPKPKAKSIATVERITPETGFLRAFVSSNNRIKSFNAARLLLSRLQKAIKERVIRKTSPVAAEILYMQQRLLDVLRAAEKDRRDFVKITIPDDRLSRLVALAGGETLYASVPLMKAYISIQATRPDAKRAESLLGRMAKADLSADPYAAKVAEMGRNLKAYLSDTSKPLAIETSDLSGLSALAGLSGVGMNGSGTAGSGAAARMGGRISAHDLGKVSYQSYPITGRYAKLLGRPAIGFRMMVYGQPGVGKSTETMRLSRYLAQNHGRVLYVSSEEHGSSTQAAKLQLVGGAVAGWDFDRQVPGDVGMYAFLVIDSVNRSGFSLGDFRRLCDKHPDLSLIMVFQTTKEGQFRGEKDWEHDCDIVVRGVAHGLLETTKNRYAPLAQVRVF